MNSVEYFICFKVRLCDTDIYSRVMDDGGELLVGPQSRWLKHALFGHLAHLKDLKVISLCRPLL